MHEKQNYLNQEAVKPEQISHNSTVSLRENPSTGLIEHFVVVPGPPRESGVMDFWQIDPQTGDFIGDHGLAAKAERGEKEIFIMSEATHGHYQYGDKFTQM